MPHDSFNEIAQRSVDEKAATKPHASFGEIARRMASWTSSLLISAIILVAGGVSGRQVLCWWRDDAPGGKTSHESLDAALGNYSLGNNSLGDSALGDSAGSWRKVEVGGQQWSMSVRSVAGNRAAAEKELRLACKAAMPTATLPREPAHRAEQSLLAQLGAATLIETSDAGWELHALGDAIPMIAVVRRDVFVTGSRAPAAAADRSSLSLRPSASAPSQTASDSVQSQQVVPCVAIWGLALPAGPMSWTAYVFLPTNSEGSEGAAVPTDIPLPPGATKSLALTSTSGGAMVSFQGPAEPEVWKKTFDRWLADGGWRAPEGWRPSGNGWYLRGRRDGAAIDVRFSPDPKGGLGGIVVVTPRGAGPTESSNP